MTVAGQLNIHSYKNPHSLEVQTVPLFARHELQAQLVVVPPGGSIAATCATTRETRCST